VVKSHDWRYGWVQNSRFEIPDSKLHPPHAGDGLLAVLAFAVVDMYRAHGVPGAFHNNLVALGTIGILGRVAGDIADVHVVKALCVGNRFGALEGFYRRGREVLEKVFGMEAREVKWNIRS
jgi:hypothetical protein